MVHYHISSIWEMIDYDSMTIGEISRKFKLGVEKDQQLILY